MINLGVSLTYPPESVFHVIEIDWSITSSNSSELYWAILYGSRWLAMVAGHIHKFPASPHTTADTPWHARLLQNNMSLSQNQLINPSVITCVNVSVYHWVQVYVFPCICICVVLCSCFNMSVSPCVLCMVVYTMTHWLMQFYLHLVWMTNNVDNIILKL